MTRIRGPRMSKYKAEVIGPLLHHRSMGGGTSCFLLGAKGCGKTTGLLNFAERVAYTNQRTGEIRPETVIWRGRDIDYWNRIAPDRRVIWVHAPDVDELRWTTNYQDWFVPEGVRVYEDVRDLVEQIQAWDPEGLVHVVYGPSGIYEMTPEWRGTVSIQRAELLKALAHHDLDIDCLFWFELLFGLTRIARPDWFCSLVGDEIQRLFPQAPRGLRYVLQSYVLAETMPDFRKTNKSMYLASHATMTIDYRLYPLIQTWGYMRGARTRPGSSVYKKVPSTMDPGAVIFDGGLFASMVFDPSPGLPLVIVKRPLRTLPVVITRKGKTGSRGSEPEYLGGIPVPVGGG